MFKRYEDMIRQMEREMQRFQQETFGGLLGGGGLPGRLWQPNVDICESDECVWVRLEASGLDLQRTRITLAPDNRVLTISGERPEPQDACAGRKRCHQLEIYFGRFQRDVLLPDEMVDRDAVSASYKDGMLIVTLPKKNAVGEPVTTIRISSLED